ncbi:PLC-like phosphodiesterase [Chytriomyces cf. hyalinus JEL632]|nr:PLC-like phosphodiesterase [Chytriomyces cf. hyalinus JEL632]
MLTAFLGLFGITPPAYASRVSAFGPSLHLMSHRGGSLEHIENTLTAFRHSSTTCTNAILEMDLAMTKDGQVVVFHDHDLQRMCAVKGRIEDLEWKDLPLLVVPPVLFGKVDLGSKEARRIPLFEDVLKACPGVPMTIDVKRGSEEMIIKVGKLIQKYKRERITLWGAFRDSQIQLCRKHFGTSIPTYFSRKRVLQSFILSFLGLTRWMSYKESCLIIPNRWYLLRPKWFEDLNKVGIAVLVWGDKKDVGEGPGGGINTIEGFERIRKSGANGICTDNPTLLQEWLKDHPMVKMDRF